MAFVPNAAVAEVVLHYTQDLQRLANVLHFYDFGGWNSDQLLQLATDVRNWWVTSIKPSVSDTVFLTDTTAKSLETEAEPTYMFGTGAAGSASSPALPNNVTLAVKLVTGLSGRSFRGRIYHVGLTEGQVVGNTVAEGTRTSLLSDYLELLNPAVISYGTLCVYSRISAGAERPTGAATVVLDMSIDPTIDAQRRRLPGRGR